MVYVRSVMEKLVDELPLPQAIPGLDVAASNLLPELVLDEISIHHPGVTDESAAHYAQAATVAIRRHHPGRVTWHVSGGDYPERDYRLECGPAGPDARRAHDNRDDTTRDGAYAIAFVSAFAHLGLKVLRRAPTLSGSDWLVVPQDAEVRDDDDLDFDREDLIRLEVSGIDADDAVLLARRLQGKIRQTEEGKSSVDAAVSAVVGFTTGKTLFSPVIRVGA